MIRRAASLCLAAAMALTACGKPPATPDAPAPQAESVLPLPAAAAALEAFPRERARAHGSQRDALRLPAGATRIVIPAAAAAGVLCWAVLPAADAPVRMTVYADGRGAAQPAATGAAWSDRSVPAHAGTAQSLVLESAQPFHLAAPEWRPASPPKPDAVVCLIDTLRKDHLGCYHYPLDTSPHIDALARDGILFDWMVPMSSWTRSSVATLLTGTLDHTHHALGMEDHLRPGLPSLAAALGAAGWYPHAVVTNPAVSSSYGFGGDFAWHEEVWIDHVHGSYPSDMAATERALGAIAQAHGRPLFLYLHTIAPHREYEPPPGYVERFMPERFVGTRQQVRTMQDLARYDGEIRFADDQFGRVVQALKDAGRYDNALIVLVSDHGEQFMEHGEMAHAKSLHFHELGVPFIVKLPGNAHAGREVKQAVQMADIAPTVLAALGLAASPGMEGRSLMPLMALEGSFAPMPAVARLRFSGRHAYAAQTPYLKYLRDAARGEDSWFDLEEDPLEQRPLREPPEGGAELKAHADAFAAVPVPERGSTSPPLTEQQREELDALGYR